MKIKMAPIAIIFTFDVEEKDKIKKNKIYWMLYGIRRASYFGRYFYEEKGLLSDLPYLKPNESDIIVRREHAYLLRAFFKKYKVRFSEHFVILHTKEAKALQITHPSIWQDVIEDLKGSPNLLVTVDF